MKNNTRKILLAILLIFTMMMSFATVSVFAEEAEAETKTFYFSNNKGWSTVNVHYWGGTTASDWPGVAATYVGNNQYGESIYSIAVPADTTHIIFNDGTSQTVDIDLSIYTSNGFYLDKQVEDKWTVGSYDFDANEVTPGGSGSGSGSGSTETPDLEGRELAVGDYYLAGYINGVDYGVQDKNNTTGHFQAFVDGKLTVELTHPSYVIVKGSNNVSYWTQSLVSGATSATFYNESTEAREKMMVPGGEVEFTLYHGDNGSLILTYTVKEGTQIEAPTIDETDTVTVYASNTMEWDSLYYYAWVSGGSEYYAWPGIEMELDENGYWFAEVPKACDNIIFNNGNGDVGNQTLNLKTPTDDKNVCDVKGAIKDGTNTNINSWFTKSECKPHIPPVKEDTNREVTLVFKNDANWTNVYVYFWSSENVAGTTWPGTQLEKNADGLYYAVIPKGNYYVIFNNGEDGEALLQTGDMKIPTDDNVLYNNSTDSWSEMYLDANHPALDDDGNVIRPEMTFLQKMAKALLLFLRSIEDFFKGLFGKK